MPEGYYHFLREVDSAVHIILRLVFTAKIQKQVATKLKIIRAKSQHSFAIKH